MIVPINIFICVTPDEKILGNNLEKKTLIFTATYNEANNIKYFLDSVTNLNLEADLLIIDDNSHDQTWKIVDDYSKIKKFVNLIIRKKKEGLDTAHKLAYEYAIQKNYDFLITMDADLSHNPKSILNFVGLPWEILLPKPV